MFCLVQTHIPNFAQKTMTDYYPDQIARVNKAIAECERELEVEKDSDRRKDLMDRLASHRNALCLYKCELLASPRRCQELKNEARGGPYKHAAAKKELARVHTTLTARRKDLATCDKAEDEGRSVIELQEEVSSLESMIKDLEQELKPRRKKAAVKRQ